MVTFVVSLAVAAAGTLPVSGHGGAATNRDDATFEHADDYDITRSRRALLGLGLGYGTHLCAGHHAARLAIGEIAVPQLYDALAELQTDERRDEAWHGWVFRGLTSLPVTWTP